MAALMTDARAPGVSAALRNRIAAALNAGERPALVGQNLRLGSIVLQRADGRDAPALREVELQMGRRNLDAAGAFDTFQPGTTRRGRGTYAVDSNGQERMIARRVGGENRVTRAGRRFYNQGYSRYILHVPIYLVRRSTGQRFRDDRYDVTGEQVGVELNVRGTQQEHFDQLNRVYDAWVASGGAEATIVPPSDYGSDVELHVDPARRPGISVQDAYVRGHCARPHRLWRAGAC